MSIELSWRGVSGGTFGLGLGLLLVLALWRMLPKRANAVTVIVLGDIARSPRICNHTRSLLAKGWAVRLVGYVETPLPDDFKSNVNLQMVPIKPPLGSLTKYPRICFLPLAVLKFAGLAGALGLALLPSRYNYASHFVLVQNPPSFPTLPVAWLLARIQGQSLIIDWHNTGSSILGLRFGSQHIITRLHSLLERLSGASAFAHLFVTDTMKYRLGKSWNFRGQLVTFHDRPPRNFRRLTAAEQDAFFLDHQEVAPASAWRLAVSSTSWTADEDFTILLDALSAVERQHQSDSAQAPLLVVVTGKGPMKADFEQMLDKRKRQEQWKAVDVRTAWLKSGEYPQLLGAADFGISLHTSSSGFDLPMKVVDMFGCGLPVLSLGFPAISELVQDGQNGCVVSSSGQLASRVVELLKNLNLAHRLSDGIQQARYGEHRRAWSTWEQEWDEVVWPLFADAKDKLQ